MRVFKVLLAVAVCALGAGTAGIGSAGAAADTHVRVTYVSPDSAGADVYIDSVRTVSDATYKTVSGYLQLSAGPHVIAVRPAGSSPSSTPWAEVNQVFAVNAYYTVAVGGRFGQLQAVAFQDQFVAPTGGQAEARFIHMAPDVPAVDVVVKGGPVLFTNISFLQASQYKVLPSGTYDLQLLATGTSQVLFTASNVAVAGGSIHSLTGIGGVGSPVELLQIPDAGSAISQPVGGANTGGGGLAVGRFALAGAPIAGLGAAAVLLLMATGVRRSRRSAR